ncbi:phycobilisome rod linker polypeptide, phycocyanin-associated [Pseudanabaena sp. lw0831]|uniref:phycobilisome rod-core linker polypeptide n=1 Tax=Pseudanabaena sp. lw0831 TaxID=1357935 RepID=UPI001915EB35|nr:phycobilisome rod-core linker polypeptide [Pseudanabaena sp. lw0831]GBO56740.1 phycobilisome rod linker polypeptide, phycocyanin-associated [Pseudanabaena sp. lw0831]
MDTYTPITIDRKSTEVERQIALHQIYAQVLERQPYTYERKEIAKIEKDFLKGKLGVRHFIGELVMSSVYLNSFYRDCSNLKFVEWSFKHLLGRALQGKEEIAKYMDLLMTKGVSVFFHEVLGSEEYRKAFGCFTIPYARDVKFYDSPRNYLQTNLLQHEHVGQRGKVIPTIYWQQLGMDCETGTCVIPEEMMHDPAAMSHSVHSAADRKNALNQIYTQVLERQPYEFERKGISHLEQGFLSGKLDVRHFLGELVVSELYLDSFYRDSSNLKFMELSFKHLLGRTPHDKEEISVYTDVLTKHGIGAFFHKIFYSEEYRKAFGCHTVPYSRDVKFHDSPRNYLQSDLIQHEHMGQHGKAVPTLYWQELGMDCETGTCVMPAPQAESHKTSSAHEKSKVKEPISRSLNAEIEELLQMLQNSDAKQVLQSMNENQRSLLRSLAK